MANTEASGSKKIAPGPVAERVRANVKAVREARGLRQEDLSHRLGELGHPIASTGITKIENGSRKVTVDDLMALAIALGVTPNRLLLGNPLLGETLGLTPNLEWPFEWTWYWATGEGKRTPEGLLRAPGDDAWHPDDVSEWSIENRPHRLPVQLSMRDDWDAVDAFVKRFRRLKKEIVDAGYDPRILEDNLVLLPSFEAES